MQVDIEVSENNNSVDLCKKIINDSVVNELIENYGALVESRDWCVAMWTNSVSD